MGDDDPPFYHPAHKYYGYDTVMLTAIILLLLAVVAVTILYIYTRCVLRRPAHGPAALHHLGFNSEQPRTGLHPSVIAALPILIFKQKNLADNEMGIMQCSVCLSPLQDGEIARTLPNCKHTFHAECIDKWFFSNSTCPICRTQAEPRPVAEPREGAVAAFGVSPVGSTDGRDVDVRWGNRVIGSG